MSDTTSSVESEPVSTPQAGSAETLTSAPDVSGSPSPAPSGEEHQAESRESLLDVVRKAAPQRAEPLDGGERGVSTAGESAAPARESNEDLDRHLQADWNSLPARTRKYIDRFRTEIRTLKEQRVPLEAQAQTTQELQNFLKQADIAKEDFGLVLDLASAMRRGDFRTFLEGVAPYVKLAQESLGIQLPADLQQAVQMGHMTQDAARYVAQVRSSQQLAATQLNRVTQETSQRDHVAAVQNFQAQVAGAVSNWEQAVRKYDPD